MEESIQEIIMSELNLWCRILLVMNRNNLVMVTWHWHVTSQKKNTISLIHVFVPSS